MQLEITLFGVFVVQIKPQLEQVLNLPEVCLMKDTKLTQDLIPLLIKDWVLRGEGRAVSLITTLPQCHWRL